MSQATKQTNKHGKAPKKVFVGLSGGVDSAVSAALLKERGFDVTGVFIRIWSPDWLECTSKKDRLDAMRVAAALSIPFLELDLTEIYKKEVVEKMLSEYKQGRTPNPDTLCNKTVKFGAFFDYAMIHGADYVATGHYAKTQKGALQTASDSAKDQTYFLWMVGKSQLKKTLFPVGGMKKDTVRKLAARFQLPNATRPDSQGLCFVGDVDVKHFLGRYIKSSRGSVYAKDGTVIGYHDGAAFLTLGERHGFTVTKKTPADAPYYVIGKDVASNSITVGHAAAKEDAITSITLRDTNWIIEAPGSKKNFKARYRHRGPLVTCTILSLTPSHATMRFSKPQPLLAPGQSVVLYKKNVCLGGAVIDKTFS